MALLVLRSVDSRWAEELLCGKKKLEFMRVAPRSADGNQMCIYASGSTKAIVGEVTIKRVFRAPLEFIVALSNKMGSSETKQELADYFRGKDACCAAEVSNPIRYENPITLAQIRTKIPRFMPPQSFRYVRDGDPLLGLLRK